MYLNLTIFCFSVAYALCIEKNNDQLKMLKNLPTYQSYFFDHVTSNTYYFFCLIINIFFGSLVNDIFSDLKLNAFIINGFICSKKYVKQVVLINHS